MEQPTDELVVNALSELERRGLPADEIILIHQMRELSPGVSRIKAAASVNAAMYEGLIKRGRGNGLFYSIDPDGSYKDLCRWMEETGMPMPALETKGAA